MTSIIEPYISQLQQRVQAINRLESHVSTLTNYDIFLKMNAIKYKIQFKYKSLSKKLFCSYSIINNILDPYINEVFALIREISKRILNMRHFDVQILGGLTLHYGNIAEMKTGEGKTLVATLPAILNSLIDKNTHIITVNSYLASRDAEWMNKIYRFFKLNACTLLPTMTMSEKKKSYRSRIIYGQNNEFGFDYLKDTMQFNYKKCIQNNLDFAIIDEVDSILIDEARTPLILSGDNTQFDNKYIISNLLSLKLKKFKDFDVNYKNKTISLCESGIEFIEHILQINNIYESPYCHLLHYIYQSIKAHVFFFKNNHYIIEKKKNNHCR